MAIAIMAAGWWGVNMPTLSSPTPRATTVPAGSDSAGDGTPDFLRLADPVDRRAFTGWFTFLAELQFFRGPGELPGEIQDCAGLVRFAYREALRKHTGAWAAALQLPDVPPIGSIGKYNYPFTRLGAALFRVRAGRFSETDLHTGSFVEFADAQTLLRHNSLLVSRDIGVAAPGDLLFFHQPGQRFPFHVMIYLGASRVQSDTASFVVYHTGPDSHSPGEVRRPSVDELLAHPNPQWRPREGNQHFLGFFRWKILNG